MHSLIVVFTYLRYWLVESSFSTTAGTEATKLYFPCFALQNEYAYRHLFVLVNVCQSSIPKEAIIRAMDSVCQPRKYIGII